MNNISIDARMINNSGIGVYLKNLITSLADNYNLILLGNPGEIKKAFPNIKTITCRSPIYSIKEQAELPFKIPASDLFITPHYNIPLFSIKAKKRLTIIHDTNHLAFFKDLNYAERFYSKFMINMAVKRSDAIITISEFSKSEILKYTSVDEQKIKLLYFGIDKEKISEKLKSLQMDEIKNKFKLNDKYILFVGNVKPHKNLSGLLRSFEILLKRRQDYKLIVVGKKEGFIIGDSEVFRLLDNNPVLKENVRFTGYVEEDELFGIYKSASIFVFPSFYEGFGIPPLEAMICDCPVIASNIASIPEVCGNAAIYIDPFSPEDITSKIELLLDNKNLTEELIVKSRDRLEIFSLTKFSHNLTTIIKEII